MYSIEGSLARPARAAAYLRKSSERQQHSIPTQLAALKAYAEVHQIRIVRIYEDDGRSGLTVRHRAGFAQLMADVDSGQAGFEMILVYDVSRWGRFQNIDESAHLEFKCRERGITVEYCAEEFKNDQGFAATLMKAVKRAVAAEFSREVSAKSFRGHCNLLKQGFHQGGVAGFGLRRMLVDGERNQKTIMLEGQRKSFQDDRVILVPGLPEEVATVRLIFKLFADEGYSVPELVKLLRRKPFSGTRKFPWTRDTLYRILANERYVGNLLYNRTSQKLRTPLKQNPSAEWIRCSRAVEPTINAALFERAQRKLQENGKFSDADLVNHLSAVWCAKGYLTGMLVGKTPNCPDRATLTKRFGGIENAFAKIGYVKTRYYNRTGLQSKLARIDRLLIARFLSLKLHKYGSLLFEQDGFVLRLSDGRSISPLVIPYTARKYSAGTWYLDYRVLKTKTNYLLIARLRKTNSGVRDFHLLPYESFGEFETRLSDRQLSAFSANRFSSADELESVLDRCFV